MLTQQDVQHIETIIEYHFNDINLLQTAFTHSSYAFSKKIESNERLEFLGDSVLNFCTTLFLYENFNLDEGVSSKTRAFLVSSENVSNFVAKNGLESYLSCDNFNPHKSINVMGDLFEAIVGAIYKDGGFDACQKFVYGSLGYSKNLIEDILSKTRDYKTELQEFAQAQGQKVEYMLLEKSGPAHQPLFVVQAKIGDNLFAKACAHNKKEAENLSAKQTLEVLKN